MVWNGSEKLELRVLTLDQSSRVYDEFYPLASWVLLSLSVFVVSPAEPSSGSLFIYLISFFLSF